MKTFIDYSGNYNITRISRWITIHDDYVTRVNKNNQLFDYYTDEYGYRYYQDNYNPKNGLFIRWFKFNGRKYATEQIVGLGSCVCGGEPYLFEDTDGKTTVVGSVDFGGDLYNPYYFEFDEYCERVRVYEIKPIKNYRFW